MNGIIGRYEKTQNLFNYDDSESGYLSNTGTIAPAQDSIRTTFFISVLPNTTYSLKSTGSSRIKAFNQNKEVLSVSTHNDYDISSNENSTFTTNSSTFYIKFSFQPANLPIMFNKGATLLPYEPYGNTWNDIPYSKLETATDAVTNLPVQLYTDGQPVSSYTIKGNTQTSGTPSPSSPVTIQGVGEETANLFSTKNATEGKYLDSSGVLQSSENFTVTDYINIEPSTTYIISPVSDRDLIACHCYYDAGKNFISSVTGQKTNQLLDTPATSAYIRCTWRSATAHNIMMNKGRTLLPYEPADMFKISILKDLQPLTPMYFSQQLMQIANTKDEYSSSGTATYNTKKYIFTGQETWTYDSTYTRFYTEISDFYTQGLRTTPFLMTHYPCISDGRGIADVPNNSAYTGAISYDDRHRIYIKTDAYTSAADFQAFLAQQYANGTPLIFYYILQDANTETVTAPTITTTGGEVTLDVDTTVKPSELDLTYHGWHEHQPLKRENGAWT